MAGAKRREEVAPDVQDVPAAPAKKFVAVLIPKRQANLKQVNLAKSKSKETKKPCAYLC